MKSRSKLKKTKADASNPDKADGNSESELPDDPEEPSKVVPKEKKVS